MDEALKLWVDFFGFKVVYHDIARSFLFHDKDWNLIQLMEVDPEKMAAFAAAAQ